jgi:hypothetical protein
MGVMLNSITVLMVSVNLQSVSVTTKGLVEKDIVTVVAGADNYVRRYS